MPTLVARAIVCGALALTIACKPSSHASEEKCVLGPKAKCAGADLSHMNLQGMDMREANLRRASLVGSDLEGANLSGANLQFADLSGASLVKTNLSGADLSKAFIPNVSADGANFEKAILEGATFGGSFSGADFRGASFKGAVSENCVGNMPTSFPSKHRPPPVAELCAVRRIPGTQIACPDGSSEPRTGDIGGDCEAHMTPGP
jgi:uncharacterized protein YjbI with pentapeptide repeats